MTDKEDVDPGAPRPAGHFGRFRSNPRPRHYIPETLAKTISLGPGTDGEPGDDWVLTYPPERWDREDREKVLVRLTPRALEELYIETKDLSPDTPQAGHPAECDLCGGKVPLERRSRTNGWSRYTSGVTKTPTAGRNGSSTTKL
jgi:hypothetical protein